MAHKKGAGSSDNGRDSKPKFLGVKLFGGQAANAGSIIIRQRGTRFHVGDNTYIGRDHTIHAKVDGHVYFTKHRGDKTSVSIRPIGYKKLHRSWSPKSRPCHAQQLPQKQLPQKQSHRKPKSNKPFASRRQWLRQSSKRRPLSSLNQ